MAIKIIDPGFNVTVQDFGRPKLTFRRSVSAIAPTLLDWQSTSFNAEYEAGLEIRLMGPTFEVLCDSLR